MRCRPARGPQGLPEDVQHPLESLWEWTFEPAGWAAEEAKAAAAVAVAAPGGLQLWQCEAAAAAEAMVAACLTVPLAWQFRAAPGQRCLDLRLKPRPEGPAWEAYIVNKSAFPDCLDLEPVTSTR